MFLTHFLFIKRLCSLIVSVLFNGFKTFVQIPLATLFYFLKYFVKTTSKNDIFTHLKYYFEK